MDAPDALMENVEANEDDYEHILVSDEEEDTKLFDEISANVETANDNAKDNAYFINIDIEKTNEISITKISITIR